MRAITLKHLSGASVLRRVAAIVSRDRRVTAILLVYLAEVDARRLYLSLGYASMHAYCVGELHFSDDAAYKRIQAARAARQFPVLITAVVEGRLHLTAVRLLAPHVTPENVDELVAAATHQRSVVIEGMLARRFRSAVRDVPTRVRPIPSASAPAAQLAPGQVGAPLLELASEPAAGPVELALGQVEVGSTTPPPPVEDRFLLQVAISRSTHDKMRRAQAAVSHSIRPGDLAAFLDYAFEAALEKSEKRKSAACKKPRPRAQSPRPAAGKRTIPAHVRRAVWARDEGRCTFVGTTGHPCGSRTLLEFDHVDPVARGGKASVERMRLRCRAHNQYEAERIFGREFMQEKRRAATSARRSATSTGGRPPSVGAIPGRCLASGDRGSAEPSGSDGRRPPDRETASSNGHLDHRRT